MQGRSFAIACARSGYHVVLEDVLPEKLRVAAREYDGGDGTLEFASTVEDAVRQADFAIDFVPDELESKLELVCMIDRMAPPRTILLIHTDALGVDDLASCTYRADRATGISFLSGQPQAKQGSCTSDETQQAVADLLQSLSS